MIECKNLVFKYDNFEDKAPKYAINGVNLEVEKGEFLVILS